MYGHFWLANHWKRFDFMWFFSTWHELGQEATVMIFTEVLWTSVQSQWYQVQHIMHYDFLFIFVYKQHWSQACFIWKRCVSWERRVWPWEHSRAGDLQWTPRPLQPPLSCLGDQTERCELLMASASLQTFVSFIFENIKSSVSLETHTIEWMIIRYVLPFRFLVF